MITNTVEYHKAEEELRDLEQRLERLQQTELIGSKGFTKAGIRKMIARLHEELAVYSKEVKKRGGRSLGDRISVVLRPVTSVAQGTR